MNIDDLIAQAEQLAGTNQKVALLEEAARLSDTQRNPSIQFHVRRLLLDAARSAGLVENALVALAYCLHLIDNEPELFDQYELLLWDYLVMIVTSTDDPAISLDRIEQMLSDLERRFQKHGLAIRPVEHARWRSRMRLYQIDAAWDSWRKWHSMPETEMCYGRGADLDSTAELYYRSSDFQKAIDIAQPIFTEGLVAGTVVPSGTYEIMMLCEMRLGNVQAATDAYNNSVKHRIWDDDQGRLYCYALEMVYLVRTKKLTKALRSFQKIAVWAQNSTNPDNRALFFGVAGGLFQAIAKEHPMVKLRLHSDVDYKRDDNEYESQALSQLLIDRSEAICNRFDQRNRNSIYGDEIRRLRETSLHAYNDSES